MQISRFLFLYIALFSRVLHALPDASVSLNFGLYLLHTARSLGPVYLPFPAPMVQKLSLCIQPSKLQHLFHLFPFSHVSHSRISQCSMYEYSLLIFLPSCIVVYGGSLYCVMARNGIKLLSSPHPFFLAMPHGFAGSYFPDQGLNLGSGVKALSSNHRTAGEFPVF